VPVIVQITRERSCWSAEASGDGGRPCGDEKSTTATHQRRRSAREGVQLALTKLIARQIGKPGVRARARESVRGIIVYGAGATPLMLSRSLNSIAPTVA
jgi:hypothetical protein